MQQSKNNVMSVEKSNINLKMDFDVRDVIDILVSEQEQNIENGIKNLQTDLKKATEELKQNEVEIDTYMKEFVEKKYRNHINSIDRMFNEMGLEALVRFEIIDGKDMIGKRPKLMSNPSKRLEDRDDKIIFALVITNKNFDRNVVDSTISFYLESDYDDRLKNLNEKRETILKNINSIKKNIDEFEKQLDETDRLVRRAKAAVTKKAIGQDVNDLLKDFREQYPLIELKR